MNEPHVVESGAAGLALCALYNLHTLDVWTEHLDRHLNAHTSELVAQQERGINAAELDAQHHTVEGVAVLESHAHNITGLDTAGIPAVVE